MLFFPRRERVKTLNKYWMLRQSQYLLFKKSPVVTPLGSDTYLCLIPSSQEKELLYLEMPDRVLKTLPHEVTDSVVFSVFDYHAFEPVPLPEYYYLPEDDLCRESNAM